MQCLIERIALDWEVNWKQPWLPPQSLYSAAAEGEKEAYGILPASCRLFSSPGEKGFSRGRECSVGIDMVASIDSGHITVLSGISDFVYVIRLIGTQSP